jgi:hypothetical protein
MQKASSLNQDPILSQVDRPVVQQDESPLAVPAARLNSIDIF